MKKLILFGIVFLTITLIVSPVAAGMLGGTIANDPADVPMPEDPAPVAPVDPCEGKQCALYCEYGYVEGSCGCACLPAPPAEIKPEQTAEEAIGEIQTEIVSMSLKGGTQNALISITDNILKSLENGNERAAFNQLNAFIHMVEAQSGKKIPAADADLLLGYADSFFDVFFEVDVEKAEAGDNIGCLLRGVDKKGTIEVQGFEHTITVPTHRQTGAATGETMYVKFYVDARLVEVRTYKELAMEGGDKPDLEQLQFRYRKISWDHKEQNTESEADWLEKSVAKKVVRFKAGSDLSTTVKSATYESGGWMKIMKKVLAADNPVEELELAIEGLKRDCKLTEAQELIIRERLEMAIERINLETNERGVVEPELKEGKKGLNAVNVKLA